MAYIFNEKNITYDHFQSAISEFSWNTSRRLFDTLKSKHLQFDVKILDPDKYSYPYHFHRNAEEIFVILSGKVMLRTPSKFIELNEGDTVFFEMGPEGAHQLHNHTQEPCRYLDIRTDLGLDVCEYPDSGKINILPYREIYQSSDKVDYFNGEENVKDKWQQD